MRRTRSRLAFSALMIAAAVLCVSFNLALQSSDWISMTLGDQALPELGAISGWLSIAFQPWILVSVAIGLHHGLTSAVLSGLLFSALLSALYWRLLRNRARLLYVIVGIWLVISCLNLLSWKMTSEIRAKFIETAPPHQTN